MAFFASVLRQLYVLKKSGPSFYESSKNSGGSPAWWVSIDSVEEQKPPLKISKLKLSMHYLLKISYTGENMCFPHSLTKSEMVKCFSLSLCGAILEGAFKFS